MTFHDMKRLLLNYTAMTEKIYGMPRGTAVSDPTYQKAQKIIDKFEARIKYLLNEKDKTMDEQQRVTDLLRELNPDEREVITARYIEGNKWDYIPGVLYSRTQIKVDRRQCFRIHD